MGATLIDVSNSGGITIVQIEDGKYLLGERKTYNADE